MQSSASKGRDIEALFDSNTNTLTWLNASLSSPFVDLAQLDSSIATLITSLDVAHEDIFIDLERTIEDASKTLPRVPNDLHSVKENALSLRSTLLNVRKESSDRESETPELSQALEHLRVLDSTRNRMEAAREVLREAENWSTLDLEVSSLLLQKEHEKAAERLFEANKSLIIFQNTPDYDSRRVLLTSLQNQLEASLSSVLVAAINALDTGACRRYFNIFSNIQRETEFRNYYYGSKRSPLLSLWIQAQLIGTNPNDLSDDPISFSDFLTKFYSAFIDLLENELRMTPFIFPDPLATIASLISSILSALQPTFSQRLSALFAYYGPSGIDQVISCLKATRKFATSVRLRLEDLNRKEHSLSTAPDSSSAELNSRKKSRRRSARLSVSWRLSPLGESSENIPSKLRHLDGFDWDQELFQPFVDFQTDYGSLEKRVLDLALPNASDPKTRDTSSALRNRLVYVFTSAEKSFSRCADFTLGYGALDLVQSLDGFLRTFIDGWTTDIVNAQTVASLDDRRSQTEDLLDLDYSTEDWGQFQHTLQLLSSARSAFDRIEVFETKLRQELIGYSAKLRLAQHSGHGFLPSEATGELSLLSHSSLNSAELHAILSRAEGNVSSVSPHPNRQMSSYETSTLLPDARSAIFRFAGACQRTMHETILSPIMKFLIPYPYLPSWASEGEDKSTSLTLPSFQIPTFSLSPTEIMQRVAESLLNLPRLFEAYADNAAISFSLHTLPNVSTDLLRDVDLQSKSNPKGNNLASNSDVASSAWLHSLGLSVVNHLTGSVLPKIAKLSSSGTAQLVSDLTYLSNIAQVLNVHSEELERWKEIIQLTSDEAQEKQLGGSDALIRNVTKMKGWQRF